MIADMPAIVREAESMDAAQWEWYDFMRDSEVDWPAGLYRWDDVIGCWRLRGHGVFSGFKRDLK